MPAASDFHLGLFALNADGGLALTRAPERWAASWPDIARVARLADRGGLDFLLPIARWKGFGGETNAREHSFETFTFAGALAGITERIRLFATVHVPMVHPVFAAKALATIDHASGGRAGLNIVCGWNPEEFAAFGLEPVADRYAQGLEWWTVLRRIHADPAPFDFDGAFYRLRGVSGRPAPLGAIPVLSAAFSPPGRDFAARAADMLLTTFTDLTAAKIQLADIASRADAAGRAVGVLAACHVVCRASRTEAEDFLHHVAETMQDTAAVDRHMAGKAAHSGSHDPDAYRLHRARFAAGAGTYPLVGTPRDVADELAALRDLGFAGAAVSLIDYLAELPAFLNGPVRLLSAMT